MTTNPTKHLYSNAVDTYVATSLEEAFRLYRERIDADADDDEQIGDWAQEPDEDVLYIHMEMGRDGKPLDFQLPEVAVLDAEGDGANNYRARNIDWATAHPVGFLCSTEY